MVVRYLRFQKTLVSVALLFSILFVGCQKESDFDTDTELTFLLNDASQGKGKTFFMLPDSSDYSSIPQDPRNPITPYKVELGKLLFHETALGGSCKRPEGFQTYSCASCHHVDAGFQSGLAQGIGEGGIGFGVFGEGRIMSPFYADTNVDVQPIRTPAALNVAYQDLMLWNGQFGGVGDNIGTEYAWAAGTPKEKNNLGYFGIETQAIAGQTVHRLKVDKAVLSQYPLYTALFSLAYPGQAEDKVVSNINAGLAIAAYERTLLANKAPFQKWLRGNSAAMTPAQKEGAILFFGKAGCVKCHTGPALNSMDFYALGMNDLTTGFYGVVNASGDKPEHYGRGGFTKRSEDMYKFKVPQLYNLKNLHFLGHGAQFGSVKDVIVYKNNGIASNTTVPHEKLSPEFQPLQLTDDEVEKIRAFVEDGLYDPNLKRYVPRSLPSGYCFPNNDNQSRIDKHCN